MRMPPETPAHLGSESFADWLAQQLAHLARAA